MNYRPLTMDDADFMLKLKNDPQTRQFAIQSHEEIKREDHIVWLEKNKQFFNIIEFVDKRVGAIRIEGNEVSIWIDKEFWGKRVATTALMQVTDIGQVAKIVNGNIASFKAFVRAGFVPVEYKDNYYILRK